MHDVHRGVGGRSWSNFYVLAESPSIASGDTHTCFSRGHRTSRDPGFGGAIRPVRKSDRARILDPVLDPTPLLAPSALDFAEHTLMRIGRSSVRSRLRRLEWTV